MYQDNKLTEYRQLTETNKKEMDKMTVTDLNALRLEALANPTNKYYVTLIGTKLAGRSIEQMREFFKRMHDKFGIPDNIILPVEYEVRDTTSSPQQVSQEVKQTETKQTEEVKQTVSKFKYFGAWYDIVVENDRGIDVKDYKGKQIAKNKILSAFNENPNIDPQNGLPFDITHYKPRVTINPVTNEPIMGVEINSYQEGLGFALTNPTHTNPLTNKPWEGRKWTSNQQAWRNHFSEKKIVFRGQEYTDVEQAYQTNKALYSTDPRLHPNTYDLMQELLEIKLRTYPTLIKQIKAKGGVNYILNSTHQPSSKASTWTSNSDNMFIHILANAYQAVVFENDVMNTPEFQKFADEELQKGSTMEAIEEYYKSCKS